jgi:hypothetical protein
MEFLADVGTFFPIVSSEVPAWEWRAAQGFCRFPGLGSTEAERLSGESRPLLRLGLSNGVFLKSTYRSDKEKSNEPEHEG